MSDFDFDETRIEPWSPDFRTALATELAKLAPEAVADGKIDIETLKELLDGDASDTSERFGLFWPGKKRAMRAAQTPTSATLAPDFENSKDWDTTQNVFIEGDNLEVLKILQKHYHGKIKMIYIDPPYNTGKDFVYPDNYREGLENYLSWSKQVNEEGQKLSSNTETGGRLHTNWLNMMFPRLKLARNLLSDDGFIAISISDEELANLRLLCDSVFGEANLVNILTVRRQDKNLNNQFVERGLRSLNVGVEYCLIYAKQLHASLNPIRTELKDRDRAEKGYWKGFWNSPDRPSMRYDLLGFTPETGQWKWESARAQRAVDNYQTYETSYADKMTLEEYWATTGKTLEFIRRGDSRKGKNSGVEHWISPAADKLRSSNWTDLLVMKKPSGMELPFESPKNPEFLIELCRLLTAPDSIVLDFFSGSGSTAQAVMDLNARDGGSRQHIQVQLPEPTPENSSARQAGFRTISDLARNRIAVSGERIAEFCAANPANRTTPLDIGFRAYKLADTNFVKWDLRADTSIKSAEQQILNVRESTKDTARQDAILTELLLKQGMSLTETLSEIEAAGLGCHAVINDAPDAELENKYVLIAYVNEHVKPSLEQLRALTELRPGRLVVLEDAFAGDDQLKTNLKQMCATHDIELKTA
ncbi:site-specific DNA-methyltransferase [Corynebacterium sp. Q4381]|uniref:site-specific DNA-methyltransferase n=1 Tax=Corynebacterium sp. Marseille-Q4381 TaxID=3121597 RepID=UPI002FE50481